MRNKLITLLLCILFVQPLFAQTTTVNISIANTSASSCSLWIHDLSLMRNYLKKGNADIPLSNKKPSVYTIHITKPQFISISCGSSPAEDAAYISYDLFVSPGDNISFKADFKKPDYGIVVTGKGSNNNQPLVQKLKGVDYQQFYGDTLPYRALAGIKKEAVTEKRVLAGYIKKYKPSAAFIKSRLYDQEYFTATTYFDFKEGNKYQIRGPYERNFKQWQQVNDSLFRRIKLNNADALVSEKYIRLVDIFLLREKERLWKESYANPDAFYKEWYNTNKEDGKKLFDDDISNLLQEKIINKYFSGKVAEHLFAVFFDDAFSESDPRNIVQIFARFKKNFPGSRYIAWFGPSVDTIIKKQHNSLNADMIFAKDNGTTLKSFDEVLAMVKGKTVLLDMWGTWCGPCRSETDKNGAAIKAHFKNKGLDYLYVANRDLKNEKAWKELIAYLDMNGTHILASNELSNDIMKKVNGTGYPTYVIIIKDGSYELSKAGYPMDREILIKQLEEALAK